MNEKKKLAIIGSGRMAWIIGQHAHNLGIETHCFSNVTTSYIKEAIDVFYNISIFDKDDIVNICKSAGIRGVIATTELTIEVASYVAKELSLPGIPLSIASVITDKYRNRVACIDLPNLCQPRFAEICKEEEIYDIDFSFPVIVKPTSKGGKHGIAVVNNNTELIDAFRYAKVASGINPVIIEEFLDGGNEYSVESLSCNGNHFIIQITEKISSGPPHCVELGHRQPAVLTDDLRKRVIAAVSEGLIAIGIDNSSCHTEIKIIDNKIYLIEFNARPGGDHIAWPLTKLSTGYDYIDGAINIALASFTGVDYSKFENKHAGVFFVTKQTAFLKPIFDKCEQYFWLYKKNCITEELLSLEHNDCYGTNSMIYWVDEKDYPIKELLIK